MPKNSQNQDGASAAGPRDAFAYELGLVREVVQESQPPASSQGMREAVEAAIDAEPELPGEIPPEMYLTLKAGDEDTIAEALRIVVRLTKQGIRERVGAALSRSQEPPAAGEVDLEAATAAMDEAHRQLGGAMDYIRDGEGESAISRIENAREKMEEVESLLARLRSLTPPSPAPASPPPVSQEGQP